MKKILVICIAILAALALYSFIPTPGDFNLYDNVIRLHIIANSNTDADQVLKLDVRDAVLDTVADLVADAATKEEAEKALLLSLDIINDVASGVAGASGYKNYKTETSLTTEYYSEKRYENIALPAGNYTSLRVVIGEGDGENWWCVLFPKICTKPAIAKGSVSEKALFIEAGFTPSQYKIITETNNARYVVKFKLIEILTNLFKKK
ncbi:MAG: stage II sporulation protein R [Eubacteriales bacterium]|jgi:stage II sporulation protein R|nr:stage II sporulation protein R [Clostridiales bacterium]